MTVWRWLLRGSGKQLCGTCFVFLREECEHQLSVFGLISLALRSDRKLWYGTEDGIRISAILFLETILKFFYSGVELLHSQK